jgi:predicted phosphodiesterase
MTPWTFVFVADMQPGSPKSYRYNPSWIANWREARAQIVEIGPDLLLVGGDLTRDGSIHRFELEEMKADLAALPFPVRVVPGNMDTGNKHTRVAGRHRGPDQCTDVELNVTSAQLQQFASVFGSLWWSFDHKGVRFSGLTDMVVNSGLPEEADFWSWADEQKRRPPARQHVWIMHSPLFVERPDEPTWDLRDPVNYHNWYFSVDQPGRARLLDLFRAAGASLVISGHVHCHRVTEAEGIRFEVAPATSFPQWADRWPDGDAALGFLRYDVTETEIAPTFIPLRATHSLPGYGPGGHPAPRARDYSKAWEKT